jgi:hypothetical protein
VEGVCVVVESLHGLEPPQLARVSQLCQLTLLSATAKAGRIPDPSHFTRVGGEVRRAESVRIGPPLLFRHDQAAERRGT